MDADRVDCMAYLIDTVKKTLNPLSQEQSEKAVQVDSFLLDKLLQRFQ